MNIETYLGSLRRAGWRIAVHNDYEQDNKLRTFYLFVYPKSGARAIGQFVKGEGDTDLDALEACWILAGRP